MRCVLDPGDAIVDCPPTFTMYAFDADVNNARVITVPRLDGFKIDIEGVRLVLHIEGVRLVLHIEGVRLVFHITGNLT